MRPAYEAAAFEFAVAVTTKKGQSNLIEDTLADAVYEMQERVDDLLRKISTLNLFDD